MRKFILKKRWFLLLFLGLGMGVFFAFRPKKVEVRYYSVQVKQGDIQSTVLSTGVCQPQNRLEIKPPVMGRIEQVLVKEGQFLHKGQILVYMSSSERALLMDTARAQDKTAESHWADLYKPIPIVSPLDGILIRRNVEPGQTVSTGDPLLVMSNHLIVNAQVDETDLGRIQVGQKAVITLDAYPDLPIEAKVDRIAYEAQNVNNVTVYNVDVLPEKIPPVMRSGMTANVNFITAKKSAVLILPFESIHHDKGKATVLVPEALGSLKVVEKEIKTGLSNGQEVEVVSGLKEGDMVKVVVVDLEDGSNPIPPWDRKAKK